jgi:hypothetical protein
MSDEIEIKDGFAESAAEVHITAARPGGWMAWYRFSSTEYFNQVYDTPSLKLDRDYYRCPYPLFPTREAAIDAARHAMHERGGEVRLVKVNL